MFQVLTQNFPYSCGFVVILAAVQVPVSCLGILNLHCMMLLYQTALEGIRKPDTITERYIYGKMEVLLPRT